MIQNNSLLKIVKTGNIKFSANGMQGIDMDFSKDIRSLSDFKRNTSQLMQRMQESGEPMVLTVNGKVKLIVQDAASYQKSMESIDYDDAVKGIGNGLMDVKLGRTKPAKRAFAELRKKHGISRKSQP